MLTVKSNVIPTLAQASHDAYEDVSEGIFGYTLKERVDDSETGMSFTIYKNNSSDEYIFAFRGTEFSAQDIYTDISAGMNQWTTRNRQKVSAKINEHTKPGSGVHIYFTGHSLGGAIAQFAAYEYAVFSAKAENENVDLPSFDLITFNSLGGAMGLRDTSKYSPGYDPSKAATINAAHFKIKGDVVSRLGDDHVGGDVLVIDKPVASPYAAHAIANFTGSDGSLRVTPEQYQSATAEDMYLDIRESLSQSGVLASYLDDGRFTEEEATLRSISALAFGVANAQPHQVSELVTAFFGEPSTIGKEKYDAWVLLGQHAVIALQSTWQVKAVGNAIGAYTLALANIMQRSAQYWEHNPELADTLGPSFDFFMNKVAKPAARLIEAGFTYALQSEFLGYERQDVLDYVT
ncbi:MAG: DUF2974 domain-containing protein, partial [Halioglobus sp.]|nr:DUF2974 domain-containing protein [Halioglobus sp.]